MPTYFFNVHGQGFEAPDLAGKELPDTEAAHAEAERIAAELVVSALVAGELPPEATIEVDDEDQRAVIALPISERG